MKREIKFRGFDKCANKWRYGYLTKVGKQYAIENNGAYEIVENKSVGQFTGIHDCDGNKIYEGDILQGGVYSRYDVEWDFYQSGWNIGANAQYFKIIGNIYETKN